MVTILNKTIYIYIYIYIYIVCVCVYIHTHVCVCVCVCVCNMEMYISDSMLCNINDILEKILVKDVYFLPNMFRYIA